MNRLATHVATLSLALWAPAAVAWAQNTTPLAIDFNNNSGLPDSQVYIGFVGGSTLSATNNANGQPLAISQYDSPNWYTLNDLPQGIDLTSFSGRIYVGYGTPWTFQNSGYEPSPVNPNDPNYYDVYDKMELTYNGNPADVADTTSFDYFSIPMTLQVYKGGTSGTLVGQMNSSPVSTVLSAVSPLTSGGAVITNPNNDNSFVRVLGPSVYPNPPGLPASPYQDFTPYLNYLQTYAAAHGGVVATIEGQFNGSLDQSTDLTKAQTYDFTVSIDSHDDLILTGSSGAISGTHTLEFMYQDLINPSGIYGANAPFYLDGSPTSTTPQNDVYGWITGDLLAGLNIGAVGSYTVVNGQQVGLMESSQWFSLTNFFSALQPSNPDYYNQYAAAMSSVSDAYNFAYTDRFAHVTVPLNPAQVDTLVINIGGLLTPEPGSATILFVGAAVLLAAQGVRRARRPRES